jgi:hypothetical protein
MASGAPHRILCDPGRDHEFVAAVERLATASADHRMLERRLRAQYPRAVVHRRELSGESGTWYVYRDGRWSGGRPGRTFGLAALRNPAG